jgi:hypothetical protein
MSDLTKRQTERLAALSRQYVKTEEKRQALLYKAREIIGFAMVDNCVYCDEELKGSLDVVGDDQVFVEYGRQAIKRWALEAAIEALESTFEEGRTVKNTMQVSDLRNALRKFAEHENE